MRLKIQQGTRHLFCRDLTGFRGGPDGKGSSCSVGDPDSIPGLGGSPEEGNVFLPEEFHGQRSLLDCIPWSHKELDTTEQLTHTHQVTD